MGYVWWDRGNLLILQANYKRYDNKRNTRRDY
jgi:hypothetical protein